MQLATFWEQLEREARPHLEQKLAALGWVLLAGSGHVWRARRVASSWNQVPNTVQRMTAKDLLDEVRRCETQIMFRQAHRNGEPDDIDELEEP